MDARVRYTKNIVRTTFFELLGEKPLAKITVKEICDKAQINRATFYKYYENAYDLLAKLEIEVLDRLEARIDALGDPSVTQIFRIVLEDILDKKEMYTVLFSENGDELFKDRLFELCYQDNMKTIEKYFPDIDDTGKEWLYYFVAEGCNGILKRWMIGGMKQSPDLVVTFLEKQINAINSQKK